MLSFIFERVKLLIFMLIYEPRDDFEFVTKNGNKFK